MTHIKKRQTYWKFVYKPIKINIYLPVKTVFRYKPNNMFLFVLK